jgi:methylglutaconyl-CoA hydratase
MLDVERNGPWATLRLNRPDVGNALNGDLMRALHAALRALAAEPAVRALVLTGAGKSFSAGADFKWMLRMKDASAVENLQDAKESGAIFAALAEFPRPVIAAVNGPARGGGVGLIAACDLAIAATPATFAFTEVRVGVVPALISPYVMRKLGESRTRRLFLTGETFTAEQAAAWGLIDRVVPPEQLDAAVAELLESLRACAPGATGLVKTLIACVRETPPSALLDTTAECIAEARAGAEAREGMAAFLEKRPPSWAK